MTIIIEWAAKRTRMVLAFIIISLIAGAAAYNLLPKEGEPEIDIPVVFISVPYSGVSAEDSEKLLIRPMEAELSELDNLVEMSATAAEGYGGLVLQFEFGWNKSSTIAEIRELMKSAEANFPEGAEKYTINTVDHFDIPIMLVNSGKAPERTLRLLAQEMKDSLESLEPVEKVILVGQREEMLEVIINPLLLEAYNLTAGDLIRIVANNNRAIAAGELTSRQGTFALNIPTGYNDYQDVYNLPIKVEGDSVITLRQLADIRLTFQDREGTARHNGTDAIGFYVFKRLGYSLIDTAQLVREEAQAVHASWPEALQQAVSIKTSNQSLVIVSMIDQLEASVLTAIALVMIVVLAALGPRASLLVGFAVPTSFLLCFAFLAIMGVPISTIVLFGLILSVGMLVDGAVVIVENADRRISEGSGPMQAYVDAAKRMFWPIVSSTATTLCAFLPMLFWPGVPGEFMGMLPITLIFVLSASLIVALIYIPIMGGLAGRFNRRIDHASQALREAVPSWLVRMGLLLLSIYVVFIGAMQLLNPNYLPGLSTLNLSAPIAYIPGALIFILGTMLTAVSSGAIQKDVSQTHVRTGHRRTTVGKIIQLIVGNPVMPVISIMLVISAIIGVFTYYSQNNLGVEFFSETEAQDAVIFVRARGNLSLLEKDRLLRQVEQEVLQTPGVDSVFATAGTNALQQEAPEVAPPNDAIGQIRIELTPWDDRPRVAGDNIFFNLIETKGVADNFYGAQILANLEKRLTRIPGIQIEIAELRNGPPTGKEIFLRIRGNNSDDLMRAAETAVEKFQNTEALMDIEDSLPLPGINWQIDVDVEKAGRFGADIATVGGMVQLVTHGLLLDTMRVDSSDEEIEIRVRLPEQYRLLSILDNLKVWTYGGQVPLSNFVTRKPIEKVAEIGRDDQKRYFDVKANVTDNVQKIVNSESGDTVGYLYSSENGPATYSSELSNQVIDAGLADSTLRLVPVNATERIEIITEWLETRPFPFGVEWSWAGDREEQLESQGFLMNAFAGALGLMFVILLAQFNSFYNSVLVLLAVVLSTTGVLLGMLVMQQPFSTIMTGIGIVALAGIVVNNNIVLIDTYQDYTRYMPKIEAIIRTVEVRIRPVLMTSITTIAGLTPMMFGVSLDFFNGGYSVDSPTALWWKQLATAVVFGLGTATILTLIFTPSMLAVRVWVVTYAAALGHLLGWLSMPKSSKIASDWALKRSIRNMKSSEIIWEPSDSLPNTNTAETFEQRPDSKSGILHPNIQPAE